MGKKCTIISDQAGSSLVAISLFIVAMGLLLAAGMQTFRQYTQATRMTETQDRLQELRGAMIDYYGRNGRFPCPAPFDSTPADSDYAREAVTPCSTNTGASGWGGSHHGQNPGHGNHWPWIMPGGNTGALVDASGTARATGTMGRKIRIGTVPTRSMNLPDKAGVDPYGHRIVYAVVEQTATHLITASSPGAITIEDKNGNSSSRDRAVVVLYSHGGDSAGAWDMHGMPREECNTAAASGENCDYDDNFVNTLSKSDRPGSDHFTHKLVYITPDVIGR